MASRRRLSIVIRAFAAALCALVLSTPVAAQDSVSEEYELAIGRAVADKLISQYGTIANVEWMAFLTQIRDRLLPFSGRSNIPYTLIILDTPIPNAISTPGYIFVTRGMLRQGLQTEGWVFVLGHEMTHTARRHVAQLIEAARGGTLFSIFIALITGSRSAVDVAGLLINLQMLGFSREKETEADIGSLRMMVEAGFDPAQAAHTLAWLNEVTGRGEQNTHWAGTHPGFLDRIQAVNAAYAGFAAKGLPLRVWYFKDRHESDGLMASPSRLVELADTWVLTLSVENITDTAAILFTPEAILTGPDGDLAVRFLRSTLADEIAPRRRIEGMLAFEKRTRTSPVALQVPFLLPDGRVEMHIPLTNRAPYTPGPSPTPLPVPPPGLGP